MMHRMKFFYFFFAAMLLIFISGPIAVSDSTEPESGKPFYFVQITDTHWGREDSIERTRKVVDRINALPMPIACVVHTGDITDKHVEDEPIVSEGLAVLHRLKVPVHFIPGNRDILPNPYAATKSAYVRHFGDLITHREYGGVVFVMVYTEPLAKSFSAEGYEPLKELKAVLDQTHGKPVIVFHHCPSVEDFYNNSMHSGWDPEIREAWTSLLNAYNVRAIIAGHFHRDEHHWVGQIPLYVSASVSGNWGRQATFRIYEYRDGKIGYRTQYIE